MSRNLFFSGAEMVWGRDDKGPRCLGAEMVWGRSVLLPTYNLFLECGYGKSKQNTRQSMGKTV